MKKSIGFALLLCVLLGLFVVCAAQDKTSGTQPPPKVLLILREFLKPGRAGTTHEKTESAFVQAFRAAKWPTQYLAVDSVSGKPRSLFLIGYDSFEAWEKDAQAVDKHPALGAALAKASLADGEVQSDADGGIFVYREDMSLRANVEITKMRYFELSLFLVKPGHAKDWEELTKMYTAAYEKIPEVRWATYEEMYGPWGDAYVVFVPMRSAKEIDAEFGQGKQFEQAMGEDGMKKLNELSAAAIGSVQTNLFMFNPRESYVGEDWIKADPDFWSPKASTMKAASKKVEKPAGQ
jgi:hypothetical protein